MFTSVYKKRSSFSSPASLQQAAISTVDAASYPQARTHRWPVSAASGERARAAASTLHPQRLLRLPGPSSLGDWTRLGSASHPVPAAPEPHPPASQGCAPFVFRVRTRRQRHVHWGWRKTLAPGHRQQVWKGVSQRLDASPTCGKARHRWTSERFLNPCPLEPGLVWATAK